MNYEKIYKEMLAKARAFYKKWDGVDACDSSLAISELKEIFPELQGNEDEKIRESLINYLKERKSCESYGQYVLRYDHWITWLEKQGEQNHVDKVEPKFEIIKAKWDVCTYTTCTEDSRIWFRKDVAYVGNDILRYDLGFEPRDYQKCFRLWTIEDGKDGDVLCTYECDEPKIVFVLRGTPKTPYVLSYHCYYNIMHPYFEHDSKTGCLAPNEEDVKPATKEQFDLLLTKMQEEGYEWDVKKKELTKL